MSDRELPLEGQVLAWLSFCEDNYAEKPELWVPVDQANLITSRTLQTLTVGGFRESVHKPVLDIDLPVKVLPSSTPNHHHLFIDKELTWDTYKLLLRVLAVTGIVEQGFAHSSMERGYSAVRLPWVKKKEKS